MIVSVAKTPRTRTETSKSDSILSGGMTVEVIIVRGWGMIVSGGQDALCKH